MKFKASVKSKTTGKISHIEITQTNKANAIRDIRGNGYSVDANKVKSPEVFNFIIENTNATPEAWRYINRLPEDGEDVFDWIEEGMKEERVKNEIKFDKMIKDGMERHKQFLNDIGMNEEEFQLHMVEVKAKVTTR
jgi:hypothetical protein